MFQGSDATLSIATENPIHPNNSHYAVFDVNAAEQTALVNAGFDGIALKKGEKYDFSLFGKVLEGKGGKVLVNLVDKDGTIIGQTAVNVTSKDWKQQKAVLTATSDAAAAISVHCSPGCQQVCAGYDFSLPAKDLQRS